ncbi:MAG: histidinol-phosphate transaminase [Nitrososphaerales archaeon]
MSSYVRRVIRENLKKYVGGEQRIPKGAIKLNQNENEYPTSPHVISTLINYLKNNDLRRYPEQDSETLKDKLARCYNLKSEQITIGNGSDEVIANVFKTIVDKGDLVTSTNPTYGMFKIYAIEAGANYYEVDLNDDYTIPIDKLINVRGKLTAVTNPNSPTGVFTKISELEKLAKGLQGYGVLLIDETYVDFTRDNALRLINKYDNVIIVRTFSKSFSLAGIRLGFGIGNEDLIEWIEVVRNPYNIGTLNQIAAIAALEDYTYVKKNIERIIEEREFLKKKLRELGFYVYPSEGNFVFIKCKTVEDAKNIVNFLKSKNIYVRYFGDNPKIADSIRITVGTHEINIKVLQALEEYLQNYRIK